MNYEEMTIEEILPFAKQGDMNAQLWLGKKAIAATLNEEAMYWLEQAANQGLAEAQNLLAEGYCILSNKKDYKLAKYWFEKAAEQNYPAALYQLGLFYIKEEYGVPMDIPKALHYFEQAANLGDVDAQFYIGGFSHYGHFNVRIDYSKAKYYYEMAVAQNMSEAQYQLGLMYFKGQGVTPNIDKAISLFEAAADKVDEAQYILGLLYTNGEVCPQDYQKGKYYFEQAANQGFAAAQSELASMYAAGLGCFQNYDTALYWLNQASEQDYAPAIFKLGAMYEFGYGVPKNRQQAYSYYETAANLGDADAQEAVEAFKKTSTQNSKNGCYVATCVYGSYDCPQVWTLRRYRDNTLGQTWYGRAFIKIYYAISPKLVKLFGNKNWFQKYWKKRLDKKVSQLQRNGVENTPYEDKDWRKIK